MEHHRKLERMSAGAPINQWYRRQLAISRGATELALMLRPEFHHAAGATHGSVYFEVLDDATFFAAASVVEDVFVLTAHFEIDFLRPVVSGEIRAIAKVTGRSPHPRPGRGLRRPGQRDRARPRPLRAQRDRPLPGARRPLRGHVPGSQLRDISTLLRLFAKLARAARTRAYRGFGKVAARAQSFREVATQVRVPSARWRGNSRTVSRWRAPAVTVVGIFAK